MLRCSLPGLKDHLPSLALFVSQSRLRKGFLDLVLGDVLLDLVHRYVSKDPRDRERTKELVLAARVFAQFLATDPVVEYLIPTEIGSELGGGESGETSNGQRFVWTVCCFGIDPTTPRSGWAGPSNELVFPPAGFSGSLG